MLAIAVVAWWRWPADAPAAVVVPDATPAAVADAPHAAAPPAAAAVGATGFVLDLVLLPADGVSATPDSVRIGLADISEDDAVAFATSLAAEPGGAGPRDRLELANVGAWLDVPATALPDGRVRVGPVPLPPHDRYDLQARGDALHVYAASFTAATMPDTIAPRVAAGLRVRRGAEGEAGVLLRRVESAQPANVSATDPAPWQALLAQDAPHLLAAFDETPWPVVSGDTLAPLPPGTLDVVLQVAGIEAARQSVVLQAGRYVDVAFDPLAEAVARAVSVDLELTLVTRGAREPIVGMQVGWSGPNGEESKRSDASGRVRFTGVDRQRPHAFTFAMPLPEDGLPRFPEHQARVLAIAVDANEQADSATSAPRVVRQDIELPVLGWLRVDTRDAVAPDGVAAPFPVYVLQREQDGVWRDAASDHFLPVPGGLAVSLDDPGRVRVAAVLATWRVLHTDAVDAVDGQGLRDVALPRDAGRRVALHLLRDGRPLADARVHVRGPVGRMPPLFLRSDAAGRIVLDGVTVPAVWLSLPDADESQVDTASAGDVSVELAAPVPGA